MTCFNPQDPAEVHPRPPGAPALDGLGPGGARFALPRAGWSLVGGGAATLEGGETVGFLGQNWGKLGIFLGGTGTDTSYIYSHFLGDKSMEIFGNLTF